MSERILSARGVDKRFGSFRALDSIDFDLQPGEVRALLGINGAGKSTFVKILSGHYRKDGGIITVGGVDVELGSPAAALRAGIASVQQHPELVDDLTAYENIYLGHEPAGLLHDRRLLRKRAEALVERYELSVDLDTPVGLLSAIERELVAILQAISAENIKVLILDEPTSVLTQREKATLFALIGRFKRAGVGVIYITHRLGEVFEVADTLTIFRGGRLIATQGVQADSNPTAIAEMMLGTSIGTVYPAKVTSPGSVLVRTVDLGCTGKFEHIAITARKGEILGVFGLLGSGLDELAKTLFGALRATSGNIEIGGKRTSIESPRDALRGGIFLVPGDRRTEGLTPTRDAAFNMTLARLDKVTVGGLLRSVLARRRSDALATQVDLQPPDTHRIAETFSGGNQQKIVIAKGLFADANIYLFVEPTVGVDIGARAKIYSLMRELAQKAAVIVMSSDADEIHGVADHFVAMFAGRAVLNGSATDISRETLLLAGLAGQSLSKAA